VYDVQKQDQQPTMTYEDYVKRKQAEAQQEEKLPIEELEKKYNSFPQQAKRGLQQLGKTAENTIDRTIYAAKQTYNDTGVQAIKNALVNAGRNSAEGRTPAFVAPQAQQPAQQEEPEETNENMKTIPPYEHGMGINAEPREYVSPIAGVGVNKNADNSLSEFQGFRGIRPNTPSFTGRSVGSSVNYLPGFSGGIHVKEVGMEPLEPSGALERIGRNLYGKKEGKEELNKNIHVNVAQNE
jgi:hypothetical protein